MLFLQLCTAIYPLKRFLPISVSLYFSAICVPHSFLHYIGRIFVFLHLSVRISISKIPIETHAKPFSFILKRSAHRFLPNYCCILPSDIEIFFPLIFFFTYLWIPSHLVLVIWYTFFKSFPSLYNQMYLRPILYSSALRFITQLCHFGFPVCHS